MRLAVAFAVLTLAGCDLVFKVDVPDLCGSAGPFISQQQLGGIPDETIYDPTLPADRLEVVFTQQVIDNFDLYIASRSNPDGAFGSIQLLPFNTAGNEEDGSFTADGLHLLYVISGQLFEAIRPDRDAPFGPAIGHVDVPSIFNGFEISADGLTIYFNAGDLYVARRPTLVSPFGEPKSLGVQRAWPSISRDEFELFYEEADQIWRLTRDTPQSLFDGIPELIFAGGDPDISDSNEHLTFKPATQGGLAVAERVCD